MSIATHLMVYVVIWWLVFFMALPIGVRTAHELGEEVQAGNADSAPVKPLLWWKVGGTTAVAGLLWAVYYVIAKYDLLGFRDYVSQ